MTERGHGHHDHGDHHGHAHHEGRRLHHDWRFWVAGVAVVLMLVSMVVYVMTMDEAVQPGGKTKQAVPAAP